MTTLVDKISNSKTVDWSSKKKSSLKLSKAFYELGNPNKADAINLCGTHLEFSSCSDHCEKQLTHANFCRSRLCSMCEWRKSLKISGALRDAISKIDKKRYDFLFLTLTVPNTENLAQTVDEMFEGFNRLTKYKAFKNAVVGYFRSLEVTYSRQYQNFNPHIHSILVVKKSYFKSDDYITHEEFLSMWRRASKLDSRVIDIRKIKAKKIEKACSEVAKYVTKPSSYEHLDHETYLSVIRELSTALENRRLHGSGGMIRELLRAQKFDETDENMDLLDEKKCCSKCDKELVFVENYYWYKFDFFLEKKGRGELRDTA